MRRSFGDRSPCRRRRRRRPTTASAPRQRGRSRAADEVAWPATGPAGSARRQGWRRAGRSGCRGPSRSGPSRRPAPPWPPAPPGWRARRRRSRSGRGQDGLALQAEGQRGGLGHAAASTATSTRVSTIRRRAGSGRGRCRPGGAAGTCRRGSTSTAGCRRAEDVAPQTDRRRDEHEEAGEALEGAGDQPSTAPATRLVLEFSARATRLCRATEPSGPRRPGRRPSSRSGRGRRRRGRRRAMSEGVAASLSSRSWVGHPEGPGNHTVLRLPARPRSVADFAWRGLEGR